MTRKHAGGFNLCRVDNTKSWSVHNLSSGPNGNGRFPRKRDRLTDWGSGCISWTSNGW